MRPVCSHLLLDTTKSETCSGDGTLGTALPLASQEVVAPGPFKGIEFKAEADTFVEWAGMGGISGWDSNGLSISINTAPN